MTTTPRRRVAVLTNPDAGHGRGRTAVAPVLQRLRHHGVHIEQVAGGSREQAERRLLRVVRQQRHDAIISVGGDGTHGVAVQAAVASGIPLAIVPAGTGNDLARSVGVSAKDVSGAVDLAVEGTAGRFDVGRITAADGGTRYFATTVTTGFDSLVVDRTNTLPWPGGQVRYLLAIGIEYARLRPRQFRLVLDDRVIDGPLILAAIGNTPTYGGGMRICPAADPRDGLLDVTVISGIGHARLQLPLVLPRIYSGTHVNHSAVTTYRAGRIEVITPDMNAYADGDLAGRLPVLIEVVPGGLSLITR